MTVPPGYVAQYISVIETLVVAIQSRDQDFQNRAVLKARSVLVEYTKMLEEQ